MYAILIKSQLAACKSTSSPEVTSRPSSGTSAIERNQQLAFRPNARHTATDSRIDRRPMRRVERGRGQRGACAQGRMPVVWQWIPRSTKGQSAGAGPGAPVFASPREPGKALSESAIESESAIARAIDRAAPRRAAGGAGRGLLGALAQDRHGRRPSAPSDGSQARPSTAVRPRVGWLPRRSRRRLIRARRACRRAA